MPISHPHRAIFVHVPKTAGTSVEAVLGMHGDKHDIGIVPYFHQVQDQEHLYGGPLQHLTAQQIRARLANDEVFLRYFKFTVVRNPWERLVSALAWTDQKWVRGEMLDVEQFERQLQELAQAYRSDAAGLMRALPHFLVPQYLFLVDPQGQLLVDQVLRHEHLREQWPLVARRLGAPETLPARMKSHHRHYRDYFSAEMRDFVAQLYATDIGFFEYEF